MGLEILHPKPEGTQPDSLIVDIIAVHGLNGDSKKTWKHSKSNHFWLDSLPLDVKGARIMNYGYNADVVFGKSTADIGDHAKSLLGSLIDERETDDESKRPIIFIAHSLGGIIVKEALVWAHRDPRYQKIKEHTLGIVFFGTPHRGSDKANYGKILANVATGVMHKPESNLLKALKSNSGTLEKLTSEFKFEAPNMQIVTFYETKPIYIFSSLIVERYSALLNLSHEDTQAVDANHPDMCKFESRDDETYKKLVKRVNRMLKGKDGVLPTPDCPPMKLRNKYFELPFDVSPHFTGRDDLSRELRKSCLPSQDPSAPNPQQRFTLYGLGGSGKTQMALKFASDHRDRFWGVFFIDTSSADMAEQAFSKMAGRCKAGESMEDFKRYLTNSPEPWLLILDNADDPLLDISRFFPVGNRGTIIVTSRNPDCRSHATVGSRELHEMESDEAITLLLRSGELSSEAEDLRALALPIVQTLGNLALAVTHAGASIRQRVCSLEGYLDNYKRHRKKLLSSRPVQASDYKYTVYTTWEISVDALKEIAKDTTDNIAANALELLIMFGFCHFDDITEDMFRFAWEDFDSTEEHPWWASNLLSMIRDRRFLSWDASRFNEAIQLLSSYSLIRVSGPDNRISLHPLVHSWIRDSLNEEVHLRWWNITVSTLALAGYRSLYDMQRQLKIHLSHCIAIGQVDDLFIEDDVPLDRVAILSRICYAYSRHPWTDALRLSKRALEYSRKTLGDECFSTCDLLYRVALAFNNLSEYQKTIDLLQDKEDVSIRVVGPTHSVPLAIMGELACAYNFLGRKQEALELAEKRLAICKESRNETDDRYLSALNNVARVYVDLGRNEEAIDLLEEELAKRKEFSSEEDPFVVHAESDLARAYCNSGQHQAALEMFQNTLQKHSKVFGEDHPNTLGTMAVTALAFGYMGQPEKGIPLIVKALEIGSKVVPDADLEIYKQHLDWLESQSANTSTTVPKTLSEDISSGKRWKFWPKIGRRMAGFSS